jgi:hypothetical protein
MRGLTVSTLLFIALVAPGVCLRAQSSFGSRSHSDLEASYLVNFFKFVQWPKPSDTATICFLRPSPVLDRLQSAIAHNERWIRLTGRQLTVRLLSDPSDNEGCQILYLDSQTANDLWQTFTVPTGILTVSDQRGFAHNGGMIEFMFSGSDSYQLAIRPAAVDKAGLTVSGALGALADRIEDARARY